VGEEQWQGNIYWPYHQDVYYQHSYNERKVDVLIKKKNIIVTILLASIDLFEPGSTCVASALDLRANDFQCVEFGRLVTCSITPSRDERTADHHDSN
jgi:hypothetical protein